MAKKTKIKKIESLLDLKKLLSEIPDSKLDSFGIGPNYESDCEISILVDDEEKIHYFDDYKDQIDLLDNYLKGILTCHKWAEDQENDNFDNVTIEGFITSDDLKRIEDYQKENRRKKK